MTYFFLILQTLRNAQTAKKLVPGRLFPNIDDYDSKVYFFWGEGERGGRDFAQEGFVTIRHILMT